MLYSISLSRETEDNKIVTSKKVKKVVDKAC